jgi:curved DNA-binding protein
VNKESFRDYYEDLQVSPNADQETIEGVFRHLAKRSHPDNRQSGDFERFNAMTEAYRVLADPVRRAAYDAKYESIRGLIIKLAVQNSHLGHLDEDHQIRFAILGILYAACRRDVSDPGVGSLYLEQVFESPRSQMEFHIWYLKEKGWIQRTDKGAFAITAGGVDAYEGADRRLTKDRLITDNKVTSPPGNGNGRPDGWVRRLLPDPVLHEGRPAEPPHALRERAEY